MLLTPDDEDELMKTLKAFIQEFGKDSVTIYMPTNWRQRPEAASLMQRINCEFITKDIVSVGVRAYKYDEESHSNILYANIIYEKKLVDNPLRDS
jgi:hypothetical protein